MDEEKQNLAKSSFESFLRGQLKLPVVNQGEVFQNEDFQIETLGPMTTSGLIELINDYFGRRFEVKISSANPRYIGFFLEQKGLPKGTGTTTNYSDTSTKLVFVTVKMS